MPASPAYRARARLPKLADKLEGDVVTLQLYSDVEMQALRELLRRLRERVSATRRGPGRPRMQVQL